MLKRSDTQNFSKSRSRIGRYKTGNMGRFNVILIGLATWIGFQIVQLWVGEEYAANG